MPFRTLLLKLPLRTGIFVGFTLCQVGEFSFIIARVGNDLGVFQDNLLQIFISVSIITMAITPFMIALTPSICSLLIRLPLPSKIKNGLYYAKTKTIATKSDHVIVIGFGVNGRNLVKICKKADIPYNVIELNPDTVNELRKTGEPIIHGDATRETVIKHVW